MSAAHPSAPRPSPSHVPDPSLSDRELSALQQACAPVGLLQFPPAEIIRTLRKHGYVEIVLGGVQITPRGLERLLHERGRRPHDAQRTS